MAPKPSAEAAEESGKLSSRRGKEARMDSEIAGRLRKIRLEIAKLEREMDELLGLNSGPRKPKRQTLSREQAKALFADARRRHREHIPA